jgi:hypothetical protein
MSAEPLTDDMANWPTDPFALLGVEPGAADADVKRAYTRLVRRFKPEHHPDQFRLIREAYEACQERAAWYRPDPVEYSPPPPPRPVSRPPAPRPPAADAEHEPVVDPWVEPAPPGDPVEEAWELAIVGQEAEAYCELLRLHDAGHGGPTLSLRLYWLLAVNAALDPQRTRHHWLADALTRSEFRGPAVELYRRELETDPAEALDGQFDSGPYAAALARGGSAAALLGVVRWRVCAAGRRNWANRIRRDLVAVRDALVMSDEAGWLGLLVLAAGWVAWTESLETSHYLREEIAGLTHLQLSQSPLFDRMEEVEQVSKDVEWGRYTQLPPAVFSLAMISFADPGYARPAEVEAAAVALSGWGDNVLTKLDTLFVKRPHHLHLLFREFHQYLRVRGMADPDDIPADLLRGLARRLDVRRTRPYAESLRAEIVQLLLENAVHPLELAASLDRDPDESYSRMAGRLQGDLAVQVAWLAGRVVKG